jgi:tRNA threonylcarbamoyladenosine biosynthesis protein TsaE
MNFAMIYAITTTDSEATQAVAAKLARLLQGGEVIELASDLGGGKTTFVQGVATALGYDGEVTSPTFTLSHVYKLDSGLELHHYDLYRLGQSGIVGEELAEDLIDPKVITLIEWAGIVNDELPQDRLRIEIEPTGDTERQLRIMAGGSASKRLLKGLQA